MFSIERFSLSHFITRAEGDFIEVINNEQGSGVLVILTTGFISVYLLFHIKRLQ